MPCPDLGALRASIDDAPGAAPALHDHVRACPSCSGALAELHHNAELAAPAIALTAPADLPPGAAEAALARFEQRRARLANAGATATLTAAPAPATADPEPLPARRRPRLGTRARAAAAALIAAVVLTGLVATPGGRAAAASFLAQFRSQRFEVLSLDPTQATRFEEVIGELVDTGVFTGDAFGGNVYGDPRVAADRDQASRMAGFAVPMVDPSVLPREVGHTPERIMVIPARETAITFDRDHALDYLRDNGRPDARLPERFDGTRLVVQLPAVVIQQFAGRDGGPALLVGKAGTLALATEGGASLEELREVLLGLPGLPAETVAQLRAIGDWRTTLPLPVPADDVRWSPTMVEGAEAIGFADQTGRLRALLWQRDGHIWGVAGVVADDEARDVANSLG
ncbi:MAG TPA: hypothetical protein VHO93_11180 [Actinomycetota bacterium]|nr:hypothetical protein [Actinomycetota bacterium]